MLAALLAALLHPVSSVLCTLSSPLVGLNDFFVAVWLGCPLFCGCGDGFVHSALQRRSKVGGAECLLKCHLLPQWVYGSGKDG